MLEIKRSITVNASAEQVYEWISQADHLQKWFADDVSREDDTLTFSWNMQDGGTIGFDAKITVDDAPNKFAYKSIEDDSTISSFELSADGNNTQVNLVESPFTDSEDDQARMKEHEGGWDWFFSRLQQLAE